MISISLGQFAQHLQHTLSNTEDKEFIDVDKSIDICAPVAEDDIIQEIQEKNYESEQTGEQSTLPILNDGHNDIVNYKKIFTCRKIMTITNKKLERTLKYVHTTEVGTQMKLTNFMNDNILNLVWP